MRKKRQTGTFNDKTKIELLVTSSIDVKLQYLYRKC